MPHVPSVMVCPATSETVQYAYVVNPVTASTRRAAPAELYGAQLTEPAGGGGGHAVTQWKADGSSANVQPYCA